MIFFYSTQLDADCFYDQVELVEKTSMVERYKSGIIRETFRKEKHLKTFKLPVIEEKHYEVYVTDMHGNGAGHYEIASMIVDDNLISLNLDFVIGDFEIGSAVMNQRILFFSMNTNCDLNQVHINKK